MTGFRLLGKLEPGTEVIVYLKSGRAFHGVVYNDEAGDNSTLPLRGTRTMHQASTDIPRDDLVLIDLASVEAWDWVGTLEGEA